MIIAAEVKRDEQGYWTHPALVRSGCEFSKRVTANLQNSLTPLF